MDETTGAAGTAGAADGLRERKKRQTYERLSETAIALFLERGFEKVSVAEIAAAADVSKPTLFRYFPAKEDLVLHRFADHEDEAARVVAGAGAGAGAPLEALHRHFADGLARRDPVTGLNDDPRVLAFHGLLYGTPSLVARAYAYQGRSEAVLASALTGASARARRPGGPVVAAPVVAARLAAGQIVAVQRVLAEENWRRIAAGESADGVYPDAVAAAELGFGQLRDGLTFLSPTN
ncbi:TetR/AcrR family transcriptional regulator [Streptomyces sp. NPDC057307]|uniref:TetR/AcrR family transcriptional regulator n=1 Tax=Streptomyces sp. NPDC057307 TaxID=3346096 RepID=UPI00362FF59A